MPEPIGPRSPEPTIIELEPVVITGRLQRPPPEVDLDLGKVALGCAEKVSATAIALLAATPSMPAAGIAGAYQAGLELGLCIAKADADALERAYVQRAVRECVEEGGQPLGMVGRELSCLVEEP